MHIVIAFIHHSLWCEFASTFNVLTLCGYNVSCCRIFLRQVSDTLGLRFLHSTLPLVLMGIHNLVTSAIWIEVIVFALLLHVIYLCYKSSSIVCVSMPIQGWHLAQRLDPFGSGRYKMVSEHMLTVGRDPRNWQAHRKDFFSTTSFQKNLLPLFSSELIQKFPFSETISLSPFDHTKIQLMRPLQEVQDIGQLRPFGMKRILPYIIIMETATVEDSKTRRIWRLCRISRFSMT